MSAFVPRGPAVPSRTGCGTRGGSPARRWTSARGVALGLAFAASIAAAAVSRAAPAGAPAAPRGPRPAAANPHRDRGEVLGRWEGTSLCVKAPWNASCHDEVVRYDFAPLDSDSVAVRLHAYKLVNGEYDWMGDLDFRPDSTAGRWVCDLVTRRGPIRWTFDVTDSALTGTLIDMEARRIGRNARARRVPAPR